MRRSAAALCVTLLSAGLLVAGCGKDENTNSGSGGTGGTGGRGGTAGNPPTDGGLKPCLDRPTELERAPSGRLPCDLLPPGLSL
ncbi:MAG TPA: hypothetical protein VI072_02555 [Polyangiaceae bacterium]